jgi:hypothetical protein
VKVCGMGLWRGIEYSSMTTTHVLVTILQKLADRVVRYCHFWKQTNQSPCSHASNHWDK